MVVPLSPPPVWMFIGYVFAINLFVGVVVDNFSRMQKETDGTALMTQEQKQWGNTMKQFAGTMPAKAESGLCAGGGVLLKG